MQTSKYEHVFPLLKTCEFSPLEHQATSGVLDDYSFSPWVFSPPIYMINLWCDLSLPLWHQFPRRVFWICCHMGLVLESQIKAVNQCDAGRGQDSLSGAGSKKNAGTSGKMSFLLWNRWLRVLCSGCTERIRLDQKQETGVTEFITEKTLVTSAHLDK